MTPLETRALGVRYGRKTAVESLSFAVPEGAVYVLLGRNGAGKSSLVRCLLGQQRPSSGEALLFGANAWRTRAAAMARTSVVPEDADAPPEMTVAAVERFLASLARRWDAASVAARLARFRVPLDVPFGRLSKGQKGVAMLAFALASSPELLVLDDPTLGLDAVARVAVFEELIGDLADRGTTVLLTTHDLAGAERLADRVGILKDGRLVLDEPLDALKSRFRRIRFAGAAEAGARESALAPLEARALVVRGWGAEAVATRFDELTYERFRQTAGVAEAEVAPMSLEEIFLAVAGEENGVRP